MWQQILVFAVLFGALVLFVWGRLRYDMVAVLALLTLAIPGVVPLESAFSGFGHPAVITVAAILVLSRGLMNSGFVDLLSGVLMRVGDNRTAQVGVMSGFVAVCSGFMNNIGALALMLPVAVRMARSSGRSPGYLLIPIAFASLLGGLTTLIGTPPNIIVAAFRAEASGAPFGMFDFTPVGAAIAGAGVLFMTLIGWRLIPERKGQASKEDLFRIEEYTAELTVPKDSKGIGKTVREIGEAIESDVVVVAIARGKRRLPFLRSHDALREGDVVIVESEPQGIKALCDNLGLVINGASSDLVDRLKADDVTVVEAVIRPESPIIKRTPGNLAARWTYGVNILAVARQGRRLSGRLRDVRFAAGDVLLLQARTETLQETLESMGCLPLVERDLGIGRPRRVALAVSIFAGAILLAVTGLVALPIAFVAAAAAMILSGLVSLRDSYDSVDWPIIVLLGAMIPIGAALESTGGATLIANGLLQISGNLPPIFALACVLIVVMILSDIVNNAAAAVLMSPVAISVAHGLEASTDPFLMAIAVGSSSAFLTPIGHQSNTLVLGPGGYRFSDYWRPGLPLSIIFVAVALPMLVLVWPL